MKNKWIFVCMVTGSKDVRVKPFVRHTLRIHTTDKCGCRRIYRLLPVPDNNFYMPFRPHLHSQHQKIYREVYARTCADFIQAMCSFLHSFVKTYRNFYLRHSKHLIADCEQRFSIDCTPGQQKRADAQTTKLCLRLFFFRSFELHAFSQKIWRASGQLLGVVASFLFTLFPSLSSLWVWVYNFCLFNMQRNLNFQYVFIMWFISLAEEHQPFNIIHSVITATEHEQNIFF